MKATTSWAESGGVRVGTNSFWSFYATWPFGHFTVTTDAIEVSYVLGRVRLRRDEINRIELFRWLFFWNAVRIRHVSQKAPPFVVFWSRDLGILLHELRLRGFQPCFDTSLITQEGGELRESSLGQVEITARSKLRLLLLRNFSFYLILSSFLIMQTASKAAHLSGLVVLICSVSSLFATSLQLGHQAALTSAADTRLSFVFNVSCLSLVVGYALFLAVERQGPQYWLQLGILAMGALIMSALSVWRMRRQTKEARG